MAKVGKNGLIALRPGIRGLDSAERVAYVSNIAGTANLTYQELFDAVIRLPENDRNRFLTQISAWNPPPPDSSDTSEQKLIEAIHRSAPDVDFARYAELRNKLEHESMDDTEHEESLGLIEKIEVAHAARMKLVVRLSKQRNETLDETLAFLDLDLQRVSLCALIGKSTRPTAGASTCRWATGLD